MTQHEPVSIPVYLRYGGGEEAEIGRVQVASADHAVPSVALLLQEFARRLLEAADSGQDGFGLVPPTPGR